MASLLNRLKNSGYEVRCAEGPFPCPLRMLSVNLGQVIAPVWAWLFSLRVWQGDGPDFIVLLGWFNQTTHRKGSTLCLGIVILFQKSSTLHTAILDLTRQACLQSCGHCSCHQCHQVAPSIPPSNVGGPPLMCKPGQVTADRRQTWIVYRMGMERKGREEK